MAKNDKKKYWWIKLETDFFYQNAIDFLMSQANGSEYVVLYQMLCLKTANSQGRLETQVGDMIMKYDVAKIQRDTKYFSEDTIMVALNMYKRLGLVYEEKDGTMLIANHENMIGYQTGAAKRVAEARKLAEFSNGNKLGTNVPKSIELRVKSLDTKKEIKEENNVVSESISKISKQIIDYLNNKLNTRYRYTSDKTKSLIKARLNEGFTYEDFITVIDKKYDDWNDSEKMAKFLRPETLFSNKFESYLNEKTKEQPKYVDDGVMTI